MLYALQPLKPREEKVIFVPNYLKKHIMKKLFALLFVAAAFTFTSCGDASGNASEEATTEESGSEDAVVVEETEEAEM